MKKANHIFVLVVFIFVSIPVRLVHAHCEIPCGIYDDEARFASLTEDIATIEKSMNQINELSGDQKNINQVVRWINNKEVHADKIRNVVTQYFMTQRIKYPENLGNKEMYESYVKQLTILHQMLICVMKAKQTTDLTQVQKLKSLLEEFHLLYHKPEDHPQKNLQGIKNDSLQLKGDRNS